MTVVVVVVWWIGHSCYFIKSITSFYFAYCYLTLEQGRYQPLLDFWTSGFL